MKRAIDICGSLAALLLLSPVVLLLCVLVRIQLGSPVFFRQMRPGKCGVPFKLMKFRTMTDMRDSEGALLPDEQRLVPLGLFLRASSLDELPELFNVLKGEMSLVGPRPLLMEYLQYYTPEQARRHEVRPGVTGLAQISGRNSLSWEERFRLDVWYVDNRTLLLDFKILLITVFKVLRKESVEHIKSERHSRFKGGS